MTVEVEVENASLNSEGSQKVQIDVKNVRQLSARYVRKLVWRALMAEHGHRANPEFEVPEAEAIAKKLISMPALEEERFDVLKHYSKKWKAYYKYGFGSPVEVYGKDEATAKIEALAAFRKTRAFCDDRPMSAVVDRVELVA